MSKDKTEVLPNQAKWYKISYSYANDKGQIRNASMVIVSLDEQLAREEAKDRLKADFQHYRINSVKIW